MMRLILTGAILVWGVICIVLGVGFLVDPATRAAGLGLQAVDATGLSTLRADLPAFFIVAGMCMVLATWRRKPDLLLIPTALFGIALLGRCVSLVADGPSDAVWGLMLGEALSVIGLLATRWVMRRSADPAQL